MKIDDIDEVAFIANAKVGGQLSARFYVAGKEDRRASLDGGIVTIRVGQHVSHVPLTNVAYLVPAAPKAAVSPPVEAIRPSAQKR